MYRFKCDPNAANTALEIRAERHEQLVSYITDGIRAGIDAHNKHEIALGSTMSTPVEINWALAEAIVNMVGLHHGLDRSAMERFIEDLRMMLEMPCDDAYDPDFLPWL